MPGELHTMWTLDPAVTFLNHGSFGAVPRRVQEVQQSWRSRLEAEPVRFFQRELEGEIDAARARLARFLGAPPDNVAFVPNATAGVNAVLRSLDLEPGDEIILTDHVYNACRNVAQFVASRAGARVRVAHIPFPIADASQVTEAVTAAVTPRTVLAVVEHVTSPTALVLPIDDIVAWFRDRGVAILVDGAHAPGMVDVDLASLGATFYSGNCHKWMCAPKGSGFLYVDPSFEAEVVPAIVSHGYNTEHEERSRFHLMFDWTGTDDPTPYLSVPAAIDTMAGLLPDGWRAVRAVNRRLAVTARHLLDERLGVEAAAPEAMIGSMAAIPLPDSAETPLAYGRDPLQNRLFHDHHIEVPIIHWPEWPRRVVRLSAQVYNTIDQYEQLAKALEKELREGS